MPVRSTRLVGHRPVRLPHQSTSSRSHSQRQCRELKYILSLSTISSSTLLCASRQHGPGLGYGIAIFFRIIGAVIDFCMDFRWRPWRDVRFSYPTCLRTRIWDCNIYNNTFTVGTPPSRKTSILSQRRWDKPLELGGTTWFLPYTFGIASDLLSVTNTQRSLHIARLSDGASHDGNV